MYKLLIIVYVVIEPMIDISELNTLLCSVVGVWKRGTCKEQYKWSF